MDSDAPFGRVRAGVAQRGRGLYPAPIRHHSPACAWAVRQMIRAVRPAHVLVEAPEDLACHIPLLLDPATKPPVAIAALIERERDERLAAYYPFCAHSPEFVALQEGAAIGASLSFIDLPAAALMAAVEAPDHPIPLTGEVDFDSGDYIAALAARMGCRDGFELWDHLFETQIGTADWADFFTQTGTYCAGIRAATDQTEIAARGDLARERRMRLRIAEALAQGGPVVAVVGGFHAPALLDATPAEPAAKVPAKTRSYLVRYGFAALDALNGYAAGLPQPGYYDFLWRRVEAGDTAPPWRETALDLVSGFAERCRTGGHPIPLPAQVEMLRIAEGLAAMRGRPGAMRHDLIDGARAALVKGEAAAQEIWTERLIDHLRGEALGDVPPSAGSPPLVEDARRRARAHRLDISDGARRRRSLDIRRKPAQREASRFLHAMALLEAGFADWEAGPDFINAVRTDLLFEEWSYAWSPQVEGRLIELSARGDTVLAACLAVIERERLALAEQGQGRDLEGLVILFLRGLLAGLGPRLTPMLAAIAAEIQAHGTFAAVAGALRRLHMIAETRGPLAAPEDLEIDGARGAAYLRLVYLCDGLADTAPKDIAPCLKALRLVLELLQSPGAEAFDHSLFEEAVDRVADASPLPQILGAVLALCVRSGRRKPAELVAALEGHFGGACSAEADRIGVLHGILATAPALLWQCDGLLAGVDRFLCALGPEAFLDLLPHLRLAMTALNPREIDRLAALLAKRHGLAAGAFTATPTASEGDLARGLAVEKALRASLDPDGIADWLQATP
ncbi:MAG: DUF5682 family protein [Pseudomonadota bacterium]